VIIPEKAGELWQHTDINGSLFVFVMEDECCQLVCIDQTNQFSEEI